MSPPPINYVVQFPPLCTTSKPINNFAIQFPPLRTTSKPINNPHVSFAEKFSTIINPNTQSKSQKIKQDVALIPVKKVDFKDGVSMVKWTEQKVN